MTQEWITVYAGSFSNVLALQATLEASGIQTDIPNETMKVVDPMITGANPLGSEIRVHISQYDEAEAILSVQNPSDDPNVSSTGSIQSRSRRMDLLVILTVAGISLVIFLIAFR